MDAFVKVRDLRKRFGDLAAVDGVSFEVSEGHTLALLGPSGCGKTTILRSIAGLETPEHGSIEIGGRAVFDGASRTNLLPEERELGIVFQSYAVWPHMSVEDNVGFPLRVRGVARAERAARVDRILEIVGLSAARDKPAPELSGGQQQRVALARALVHEPRLVLFDEPLSNLDAQLRDQMRLELKVLQDRLRFTAIYVTHDQAEAFALAESVVVMNRGRIETIGSPREVFRRPRTPFVARFLGLNVWPGTLLGPTSDGPDGQRYAQVTLADGFSLWGVIDDDHAVTGGAPVVACLRKEHVGVRPVAADRPKSAAGFALSEGQTYAGEVRAASFLGLEEELMIVIAGMELRAVRPASGVGTGDAVEVSIRPQDCLIFRATAGRLDE
ncbi:MAG: ABC transporter ATP-binding protein [Xanthobacteraceae bacterium]